MTQNSLNTEFFYRKATEKLPLDIFSFIDSGSGNESAIARNRESFDKLLLVPRVLRGIASASTEIDLFNHLLASPILIAPSAY